MLEPTVAREERTKGGVRGPSADGRRGREGEGEKGREREREREKERPVLKVRRAGGSVLRTGEI